MDTKVYDRLRKIVYDRSGISIKDGKMSMVASRIARRLRALNLSDELAYVNYLEDSMDEEIVHLLDAISTNVTSFFRESHHFDQARKAFEVWLNEGQTRFRLWSAASSTGEEPYTLAMTLLDVADRMGRKPDIKILATDISTRVLDIANEGTYPEDRVSPIPLPIRNRYMSRVEGERGESLYKVSRAIRNMVVFKRMNLSTPPFVMKGPMDMIFCRNVMIYFDQPVRMGLLREFHRLLRPDGYLMVGHSESLTQVADIFERSGSSVYQPVGKAA